MPLDRKLSLNALRAFEASARRGSFSAAAGELNVSVAAVSRHVTLLEAQFGCKLFRRIPSGVELTERGRLFYPNIEDAFTKIELAHRQIANERLEGKLYVSLYSSFAVEWLVPRLDRFRSAYPDIHLRLKISTEEADFDSDRVDLALTGAPANDSRLNYDLVFDNRLVPVCAPDLIERERLDSAEQLFAQTLLYETRESFFWRHWFEAMGLAPPPLERGIGFESASHAYQVARSGGGIALMQTFYLADELAAGRLATPVPMMIDVPVTYRLASRRNRMDHPLLSVFRLWLLAEAATTREEASLLLLSLIDPITGAGDRAEGEHSAGSAGRRRTASGS